MITVFSVSAIHFLSIPHALIPSYLSTLSSDFILDNQIYEFLLHLQVATLHQPLILASPGGCLGEIKLNSFVHDERFQLLCDGLTDT